MSCEDSSYCPSLGEETDALLGSRAVKSQGGFFKTRIRGQERMALPRVIDFAAYSCLTPYSCS